MAIKGIHKTEIGSQLTPKETKEIKIGEKALRMSSEVKNSLKMTLFR